MIKTNSYLKTFDKINQIPIDIKEDFEKNTDWIIDFLERRGLLFYNVFSKCFEKDYIPTETLIFKENKSDNIVLDKDSVLEFILTKMNLKILSLSETKGSLSYFEKNLLKNLCGERIELEEIKKIFSKLNDLVLNDLTKSVDSIIKSYNRSFKILFDCLFESNPKDVVDKFKNFRDLFPFISYNLIYCFFQLCSLESVQEKGKDSKICYGHLKKDLLQKLITAASKGFSGKSEDEKQEEINKILSLNFIDRFDFYKEYKNRKEALIIFYGVLKSSVKYSEYYKYTHDHSSKGRTNYYDYLGYFQESLIKIFEENLEPILLKDNKIISEEEVFLFDNIFFEGVINSRKEFDQTNQSQLLKELIIQEKLKVRFDIFGGISKHIIWDGIFGKKYMKIIEDYKNIFYLTEEDFEHLSFLQKEKEKINYFNSFFKINFEGVEFILSKLKKIERKKE